MDPNERLNLQKMISANDTKDNTATIRALRHSDNIKEEVDTLLKIKRDYARLANSNPQEFDALCVSRCQFLFNNYTDIYNKIVKDEMDLGILSKLLETLKRVEESDLDQHEASFEVGKLLKKIYIDSALKKADKLDKQHNKEVVEKPVKKLSWSDYKKMGAPTVS
jgi:hypothetical protein